MNRKPHAAEPLMLHHTHAEAFADMLAKEVNAEASQPVVVGLNPEYSIIDGIAVVDVSGYIMPSCPYWMRDYATGMDALSINLMAAVEDVEVNGILLSVNSPGGYVTGVEGAANTIKRASELKPLIAHVDGYACSAAYWLASQSGMIAATKTSAIGSIGTLITIDDWSRMLENAGIATHVIASAEMKTYGDKLSERPTDRQLGDAERMVKNLTEIFVETVAAGRNVSVETARSWATGEVWL
jgi:signal peptide peptidase SppA